MATEHLISPADFVASVLVAAREAGGRPPIIDVRSEGEYVVGHLPGSLNLPILTDPERHEVGLTYKTQGQDAAIALGHRLVEPTRPGRVARWLENSREPFVLCWRGGLRSKIACAWMRESGGSPVRVEGGYKAVRARLLDPIERQEALPAFLTVTGYTGSGKTILLRNLARALPSHVLDLESLANHRGSAFGNEPDGSPQPAQATFDNLLGISILGLTAGGSAMPVAVEDESKTIGRIRVPDTVIAALRAAPTVLVEESVESRAIHIYREYVEREIAKGVSAESLQARYLAATGRIEKKLGGLRTKQAKDLITRAFENGDAASNHTEWIAYLLVEYYDPLYAFSLARQPRRIAFQGPRDACEGWMRERLAKQLESPVAHDAG